MTFTYVFQFNLLLWPNNLMFGTMLTHLVRSIVILFYSASQHSSVNVHKKKLKRINLVYSSQHKLKLFINTLFEVYIARIKLPVAQSLDWS